MALVAGSSLLVLRAALALEVGTPGEPGLISGQVGRAEAAAESIQSINDAYDRQLLELERQRLERLGRLASTQTPKDAAETYEMLFHLAINNNLFREAEPISEAALKSAEKLSPLGRFLAHTINIIAEADRGVYEESLANLRKVIAEGSARNGPPGESPAGLLGTPGLLSICGVYYQRLIQGERFDVARKALRVIHDEATNPAVKEYCNDRLHQLELVGKPAPAIHGTDVDAKPVNLADLKGNVVLVVFWASWCLPSSAEVPWQQDVYETYRNRGFRIVGINLDTLLPGTKRETVTPNVRRFLLEHNIRWPNLINGDGPNDYARAYRVTDSPTNYLIDRDGSVIHLDLTRKHLSDIIARAVAGK
jgi:thiol-disulfide isomerase/thioredoxin